MTNSMAARRSKTNLAGADTERGRPGRAAPGGPGHAGGQPATRQPRGRNAGRQQPKRSEPERRAHDGDPNSRREPDRRTPGGGRSTHAAGGRQRQRRRLHRRNDNGRAGDGREVAAAVPPTEVWTVECNPLLGPKFFELALAVANGEKVPKWIPSMESIYFPENAKELLSSRKY